MKADTLYGPRQTIGGDFRSPLHYEARAGTGAELARPTPSSIRLSLEGDAIAIELPRDRHVLTPDEARTLGQRLVRMADIVGGRPPVTRGGG